MVNALLGIKKHMTSVYDSKGRRVGATVVALAPNTVTQIKTKESDGYSSVQLGIGNKKSVKKPQQGHLKKAGAVETTRFLREVRIDVTDDVTAGQEIRAQDVFHAGDLVKVQGISKGKGFQGGVRRHGFHGGPKTHGQSDRHRAPGSIGQGTTPGRVYKGKRMAGHMGVDTVSIKGLEVIKIDRATNDVIIKGGIPGPIGGLVKISYAGQVKGYVPVEEEEPVVEEEVTDVEQTEVSEPVEAVSEVQEADVVAEQSSEADVDANVEEDSTEVEEKEVSKE